jgi:hypothetical protein
MTFDFYLLIQRLKRRLAISLRILIYSLTEMNQAKNYFTAFLYVSGHGTKIISGCVQ